jgi:hypothetical protein
MYVSLGTLAVMMVRIMFMRNVGFRKDHCADELLVLIPVVSALYASLQ